ncbi:hypothetical protein BGY98DRAFT_935356 [Russula aff. rugulosa BPL654]|nr:hypothetical protein BGY98DRAFT_935356 [Russula aff. rugulosa BPL654]
MQSRWEEVGKKKLAQATTNASHGVVVLADAYLQAKIQVEGKYGPSLYHAVIATVPFTPPNAARQASLYFIYLTWQVLGGSLSSSLGPLLPYMRHKPACAYTK